MARTNARAELAAMAPASGWRVRRGDSIADGDTFTRDGVTVTAYYTRRGAVLAATHDDGGANVLRLTADHGHKREHVREWLARPRGAQRNIMHDIVRPGDVIICGGAYSVVTSVVDYAPGEAPAGAPMRADYWVREFRTADGSRWRGYPDRPTD